MTKQANYNRSQPPQVAVQTSCNCTEMGLGIGGKELGEGGSVEWRKQHKTKKKKSKHHNFSIQVWHKQSIFSPLWLAHMRFWNTILKVRGLKVFKINPCKSIKKKNLMFNRFLIRSTFCKYFTAIQWYLCWQIKGSAKLFYIFTSWEYPDAE